jgi:hypothetical protein
VETSAKHEIRGIGKLRVQKPALEAFQRRLLPLESSFHFSPARLPTLPPSTFSSRHFKFRFHVHSRF